ncbi:hypothetical protein PPYR_10263 [Photinus pyralis]|uniref:phosphoinositide 5-phosphatase n=2 Tax=Photinus pyralis TaxID=7054 RepID=A0A1Y1LG91_PHOPY|nr:inositol polyphosphate 5-phosphatase E isoform X1 [Photinus pyralis]KAB0796202.1 hypothetical protein PPYR_10263 [Photinus pyralis]
MENTRSPKQNKPKKLVSKLLPNKIPNKVGIAQPKSTSTSQVDNCKNFVTSDRPLSIGNYKMLENEIESNGQIRRSSSISEGNFLKETAGLDNNNKLHDRSVSIDNVFRGNSAKSNSSMDSLARKALMAAQVLHLIPTVKARQRNYLQGRVAANPLLGTVELERNFPTRDVTIFVGTWNMNGRGPPSELNDFVLPVGLENVPDVLAFGTQESCSERYEWEVCLQETIGPSHVLFHSHSLGTLHLAIFLRRDLIWYCSMPEDASLSVRPGTAFKTKGAVAVCFMLFGTSFLFVTAHLTAHQEKVKERVSDITKIVNSLDLPRALPLKTKNKDVTQNFDYVFWSGDLNFRLTTPRTKVLEWLSKTSFPLPAHLPHGYLHNDQLCSVLSDGAAFKGFLEANITFPPTYKYDPGTQTFDTSSKQRTPAYTDRILYKQRATRRLSGQLETVPLQCLIYDSVPSITTSDHKPVWGVFRGHLRPGLDTIPLAAGLFNREVYMEGLRRRATLLSFDRNGSAVCSIQ